MPDRPSVPFVCTHNAGRSQMAAGLLAQMTRPLTDESVREADVVTTMGCGDACPISPGKRYEDWKVEDPAGESVEKVRRIRDDIADRVRALIASLAPA